MSNIPISKLEIFWSEFANNKICWSIPFEKALIKSNIVSKQKIFLKLDLV